MSVINDRCELEKMATLYEGILVLGAIPESTAAKAGLRYGDILLELNGDRVPDLVAFARARAKCQTRIEGVFIRMGVEVRFSLPLGPPQPSIMPG